MVKKEANLMLEMADVDLDLKVRMPGAKKAWEVSTTAGEVQVPVLINPQAIPAHTMLIATEDLLIHKLTKARTETKPKDKK